jgi:hypothetical protein
MKKDWVAEVFSAMRDCGEDISIVYGQVGKASNQARPQWFELQHNEFDGMSGLACLLRRQGRSVDRLPLYKGEPLTWRRALQGLGTILPEMKSRPRQWRHFLADRTAGFAPVAQRVAWHFFSAQETQAIVRAAAVAGCSVNTYLLFHLDAVVRDRLVPPEAARRWMLPINLRGAVTRHLERAPHMAFLGVDIDKDGAPAQVQQRIDQLRQRAYHWGVWIMLHAGRLLGGQAMRRDIRKREREQHGWTGIFSNLGVWHVPGADHWLFCPAISRVYPVGAGCLTMNGHMALTVQLHDVLGLDMFAARGILAAWKQGCLAAAGVADTSPMQDEQQELALQ